MGEYIHPILIQMLNEACPNNNNNKMVYFPLQNPGSATLVIRYKTSRWLGSWTGSPIEIPRNIRRTFSLLVWERRGDSTTPRDWRGWEWTLKSTWITMNRVYPWTNCSCISEFLFKLIKLFAEWHFLLIINLSRQYRQFFFFFHSVFWCKLSFFIIFVIYRNL